MEIKVTEAIKEILMAGSQFTISNTITGNKFTYRINKSYTHQTVYKVMYISSSSCNIAPFPVGEIVVNAEDDNIYTAARFKHLIDAWPTVVFYTAWSRMMLLAECEPYIKIEIDA